MFDAVVSSLIWKYHNSLLQKRHLDDQLVAIICDYYFLIAGKCVSFSEQKGPLNMLSNVFEVLYIYETAQLKIIFRAKIFHAY